MSDISDRILSEITSKGYSYGELAKITGIPKSAIQRYATGETVKIPLPRLEQLAAALNVPSSYFMGWSEKEESPGEQVLREVAAQMVEDNRLLDLFHKADERDRNVIWSILSRYEEDK